LLPNDTECVIHVPVQELWKSPIGRTSIDAPGVFAKDSFMKNLGIPLEDMEHYVQALNFKHGWSFHVIRTSKPLNMDAVKDKLHLKPAPEGGGKGQDYLVAESSEWLNSLVRHKAALAPASLGPLAVRQHDKQTLIFGDVTPVREFLLADG